MGKLEASKGVCLNINSYVRKYCIVIEIACIVIVQHHVFFYIVSIKIYNIYDIVLLLYVESVQLYLKMTCKTMGILIVIILLVVCQNGPLKLTTKGNVFCFSCMND